MMTDKDILKQKLIRELQRGELNYNNKDNLIYLDLNIFDINNKSNMMILKEIKKNINETINNYMRFEKWKI